MTEFNTVSFNDFVALGEIIWLRGLDSVKPVMRNSGMVKIVPIPEHSGESRKFDEIDTNEYLEEKSESDQAARGEIQQGYNKTMYAKRMANNTAISYEMRTRNKYEKVTARLFGSGRKGPNTIDLDLSHRLTFGAATTYTDKAGNTVDIAVGDGLALYSSVHTLAGSTTTYRNILANNPRVSKGAIEGMERLVTEETYNNLGEKMSMSFDIIFSGDDPNTCNTIAEYLKSKASPEAAHEGVVNVYAGKYRHVVIPRLATDAHGTPDTTKRYYWGIASSIMSSFYLGVWEESHMIPPSAGANSENEETDDWTFRDRVGYGICIVGAAWIKFSKGDGSA